MSGAPFDVVATPPLVPPRVGLIAAVAGSPFDIVGDTEPIMVARPDGTTVTEQARWTNGFHYLPEACDSGFVIDPCATTNKTIAPNPAWVEFDPYGIWAGSRCSAMGWTHADYEGRATRLLAAVESHRIAHELWTGDLAFASGWPNAYLASPEAVVLSSGAMTPSNALACLEQALADCSQGQRGMIHCTPAAGTAFSELGNTIRNVSGQILTFMDTIIVPDAGYTGSGPAGQPAVGGSQWVYATGMVTVRRSSVTVLPDSLEAAVGAARNRVMAQATLREQNTVEFRAERLAAATWNHACCHVAVEVNVPMCGIGS